jgi:hypothetical protein
MQYPSYRLYQTLKHTLPPSVSLYVLSLPQICEKIHQTTYKNSIFQLNITRELLRRIVSLNNAENCYYAPSSRQIFGLSTSPFYETSVLKFMRILERSELVRAIYEQSPDILPLNKSSALGKNRQ